jgi:multimeric flavodoxin WrbA
MQKSIIIFGSARSEGDTRKLINEVINGFEVEIIDLNKRNIAFYNYDHNYPSNDEFIAIIEKIIDADNIIFATPVYWFTMSGVMKIFLDRFSDLLNIRKDLGRKLRGKNMFLISSGSSPEVPECFKFVFKEMAKYLGMKYMGTFHGWTKDNKVPKELIPLAQSFSQRIFKQNE